MPFNIKYEDLKIEEDSMNSSIVVLNKTIGFAREFKGVNVYNYLLTMTFMDK